MGLARALGGYVLCLGLGALGVLGPSAVQAQAFLSTEVPAEFPPASFRAAQYVDSRGCVYVRAGASGVVNWVPRINRQRQHICNAQPSLAAAAPAPAPVAVAAAPAAAAVAMRPARVAQARVEIQPPQPMRPRMQAASAPITRVIAPAPATAPATAQRVGYAMGGAAIKSPRAVAPFVQPAAPQRRVVVPAAPAPMAPAAAVVAQSGGCQWASAISAQYMQGSGVRCGPQAQNPVGAAPRAARMVVVAGGKDAAIGPNTRVVPAHVATSQAQAADVMALPKGYRWEWEDDRLNPYRAQQTPAGMAAMAQVWDSRVPARPVRPNLSSRAEAQLDQLPGKDRAIILTARQAPRFVQLGSYANEAQARTDARRVAGKVAGLHMGTHYSASGSRRVLLAGPYDNPTELGRTLNRMRSMGFDAATLR
ncbi:MAG: hypothetical protein EBR73_15035 [Rhodobacteraceae bacterium]|nr:hypothetical protein [Paracoccaceae bacterium]